MNDKVRYSRYNPIRTIYADMEDLNAMLDPDISPEVGGDYFYLYTELLGGSGYFKWHRQMELLEPGLFAPILSPQIDCCDHARYSLSPYIKQIDKTDINFFFGRLLDETNHGLPVFELTSPESDGQALIWMRYFTGDRPEYDCDVLANEFSARQFGRYSSDAPGSTDDPSYEAFVVDIKRMVLEFLSTAHTREKFQKEAMLNEWRQFDLTREYYRQQMAELTEKVKTADIRFVYGEDYLEIWAKKPKAGLLHSEWPEDKLGRFWYNDLYLNRLRKLKPALSLLALTGGIARFIHESDSDDA